jgi:hypothetical protein
LLAWEKPLLVLRQQGRAPHVPPAGAAAASSGTAPTPA